MTQEQLKEIPAIKSNETVRLTMSQALVKYMIAQKVEVDGEVLPLFEGMFAIFGHGNVAGLGEALHSVKDELPTYRAQNEQAMAHMAIAFAKENSRQRMMACTSSIGPGATNMVTAAALAHVNRLPVLFLLGEVFASREPDPVLQQIENFSDPSITANDCFKPVSRYWDRIDRPEQLLDALPKAIDVLTDPANCGPATLCLPQDVQTFAHDFPVEFFAEKVHKLKRQTPDETELAEALEILKSAERPLIVSGGGVQYSRACEKLSEFAKQHNIPVAETQAGKGNMAWDHPNQLGAIGVTGTSAANTLAAEADVVLAIGTRLSDFTTGSRTVFSPDATMINLNTTKFDAKKHGSVPLVGDALKTMEQLSSGLGDWQAPEKWLKFAQEHSAQWNEIVETVTKASDTELPSDAQVIGAVNRQATDETTVVCAAGGLPGELHKLWQAMDEKGYHVEYGYSCMGYEIAGGVGAKMANPERDITVMVGDGSYLMMNSEITTSVALDLKITIVVLDNSGYGCINRLQQACGGAGFNNLYEHCEGEMPKVDFAAHAASLGASSEKVTGIAELEKALERARKSDKTYVIAIDTDPLIATQEGGCWWEVAVPEVSDRKEVQTSYVEYLAAKEKQAVSLGR